jgi:ubiquitin conjugation factor E4 B
LFIRFVNLLVNDVTFLLDESISKLAEIHSKQVEISDPHWLSRPANERQDVENGLRTLERQCESYLQLTTSTLDMLEYFTTEIIDPFVRPEVVDRLAAMLCHNILQMVGPKCTNLKVKTPEKYHWEPRTVLRLLVGPLLNMSRREAFLQAVARDTRSFSRETFHRAAAVLRRHSIRSPSDIARLERIADRVAEIVGQGDGDIEVPDEYLDPLMFTVMKDPVRLTTSNMVVDRSTIFAHLLNDQTDPFNRMPLTMDQVIPETDLHRRIQEFLNKK